MEETKKVERIPGTHYVKIDHNIFNTLPANAEPKSTICLCLFCGDKFASASGKCSIYCAKCKKAESRKEMIEENKIIDAENRKKNYNIA
jgi:hypothetical protein